MTTAGQMALFEVAGAQSSGGSPYGCLGDVAWFEDRPDVAVILFELGVHRVHITDHVGEIMFDAMFDALSAPEPRCVWCNAADHLGIWAAWGVHRPFDPDDWSTTNDSGGP